MLTFWAQFWSNFQTLENQFEQGSGRFVGPEPAFNMGPRSRAEKNKTRNTKKDSSMKPNASLCRKEPFQDKQNVVMFFDGLGLLAFLLPNTSNDNCEKHYKTRCFVILFGCSWMVVVTQTTKAKQQTTNNKQQTQQNWKLKYKMKRVV